LDISRETDVKFVIFIQEMIRGFCKKYVSHQFVDALDWKNTE